MEDCQDDDKGRYRPKGVIGKGVGNSQNASEMRQKCVRNASEMRQKCVKNASCFIGKKRNIPKCVTPLGENTFWTIPEFGKGSKLWKTVRMTTKGG